MLLLILGSTVSVRISVTRKVKETRKATTMTQVDTNEASLSKAPFTISDPIPGRANTFSTTQEPPRAEEILSEMRVKKMGREGFNADDTTRLFSFIPFDRAVFVYGISKLSFSVEYMILIIRDECNNERVREGRNRDLKCIKNPLLILEYPDTGNSFNHKLNIKTNNNDVKNEGRTRKADESMEIILLSFIPLFCNEKKTMRIEKKVENSIE